MRFIIEHLSKKFEKKEVLKDVDFTFEEGKIYGLLGRNGAGKTTLFNCLNRDIKADGGSFYLEVEGQKREVVAEDMCYLPLQCQNSLRDGNFSNFLWISMKTILKTSKPLMSILII